MQVITKATLDQFQNALGLNRRTEVQDSKRVYQINASITPTREVVLAVASAWHAVRVRHSTRTHSEQYHQFFENKCKIRLVYASDERTPAAVVGGYIVLNGELMAMYNHHRGRGEWMLDHAINDGAVRLNCVDEPHLIKLYTSRGFKEVHREFNEVKGRPDVVWMEKEDEREVPND